MQLGILLDQLRLNWRTIGADVQRGWPDNTRLVELSNAVVRVRSAGSGDRTIMLTPDAPVVLENYIPLMNLLAPHARVVCFEYPGCGFSFPRFGFGFTLQHYVETTKSLMDALEIQRATLAFTCVNAMVAMAFAHQHPDRVDKLVLSQVASVHEMHEFVNRIDIRLAGIRMFRTPVIGQLFMMLKRNQVARGWFKMALPKGFPSDSVWDLAKPAYESGCVFCVASLVQGQSAITAADLPVNMRQAAIIWGDADRTHAKTNKESIHEHLPHAVITRLPDRGHCLDIETPEQFSQLVLSAMRSA
ncbi:MAG: alpha/beta hydrolase [Xanthobacteraceae bacterium]|nr:alpha/beta hydrolase [Xanthobacteraceae bacterium]